MSTLLLCNLQGCKLQEQLAAQWRLQEATPDADAPATAQPLPIAPQALAEQVPAADAAAAQQAVEPSADAAAASALDTQQPESAPAAEAPAVAEPPAAAAAAGFADHPTASAAAVHVQASSTSNPDTAGMPLGPALKAAAAEDLPTANGSKQTVPDSPDWLMPAPKK